MLYYYINLRSSVIYFFNLRSAIILCLSSEGISLSLGISSSFFSELFCGDVFETLAVLSEILFPIKMPAAFAVCLITFFEEVLSTSFTCFWRNI